MIKYILLALFITGCSVHECEVADVRCDGQVFQVCGSENAWLDSIDCSSIEPAELNWICCINKEGCVPQEECK